jgi:DNA replication protein DnaC
MKLQLDKIINQLGNQRQIIEIDPRSKEYKKQWSTTINWLKKKNLTPPNKTILNAMVKFLIETKLNARNKGLMLLGTAGTGKTVAMQVIASVRDFHFYEAYQLSNDSKECDTYDFIKSLTNTHTQDIVIDDLGDELIVNDYGVKNEFMIALIRQRHKDFIQKGQLTLITSNLGRPQLEDRYGKRIVSRITQMCEVVTCNGEDLRCK